MNTLRSVRPLFELGRLLATQGARALLERAQVAGLDYVRRHVTGDFGELGADDVKANWDAVCQGSRVLSAYTVGGERLWIITEADRSATTLLLPEEY